MAISAFIRSSHDRLEDGTGVLSSLIGAFAFLLFLFFAIHILIGLYASSITTAVAWEEAKQVAVAKTMDTSDADNRIHTRLTGLRNVTTRWDTDNQRGVGLTITADKPTLLPQAISRSMGMNTIRRHVWVRAESWQ